MDQNRLSLSRLLRNVLGNDNTYFSPPTGMELKHPCIVYTLSGTSVKHADNIPYNIELQYQVTVIDENPDSDIFQRMLKLPKCRFNRHFCVDGLNHYVFTLYFKGEIKGGKKHE